MSCATANESPPSRAETAKVNKYIKDTLNQIENMEKKKRKLKLLLAPRRATAKLDEFSAEFYHGRKRISERDFFSHLPVELLSIISKLLKTPDRVALALTSKHLMGMIAGTRAVTRRRRVIAKTERLAVLVRLQQWMPPGMTLCYPCVKFLPSVENGPWGGDFKIPRGKLANKKAMELGPRCKYCTIREGLEMAKAGQNAQKLMRKVREM